MIPKLTDFTLHELEMAKELFHNHKGEIFVQLDSDIPQINRKYTHYDWETACLWYTKITEAMQIVKDRETTNQN